MSPLATPLLMMSPLSSGRYSVASAWTTSRPTTRASGRPVRPRGRCAAGRSSPVTGVLAVEMRRSEAVELGQLGAVRARPARGGRPRAGRPRAPRGTVAGLRSGRTRRCAGRPSGGARSTRPWRSTRATKPRRRGRAEVEDLGDRAHRLRALARSRNSSRSWPRVRSRAGDGGTGRGMPWKTLSRSVARRRRSGEGIAARDWFRHTRG